MDDLVIETKDGERHLFPVPEGAGWTLMKETEELQAALKQMSAVADALEEVFTRG